VLLNDPEFVEAARVLAARIARQPGGFDQRIGFAYAQTLGRQPRAEEVETLGNLFKEQRAFFDKDRDAADRLVSVGEAPRAADLNPAEVAAWTSVSRALLNLHETITRN
jgi:hypothetical protein